MVGTVDPEDPKPEDSFPRVKGDTWHYVPGSLASSIVLGSAQSGIRGADWVLSFTPETEERRDREPVHVRLEPEALNELYTETKDLSTVARQAGTSAECWVCGGQVAFDQAVPDNLDSNPIHRHCYAAQYGAPEWLE